MICRCHHSVYWPVNIPVTSLHCSLSKASKFLDSFSEGPSVKSFDSFNTWCGIPVFGVYFGQPTHSEIVITCSGPINRLFDFFLAKVAASLLLWIYFVLGPREAFPCWHILPVHIPRPALTLLTMPQGLAKLPGYLSKCKFAALYISFSYSSLQMLKLQIFLSETQ